MTENEAIKEMKYYSEEEYGKGLVSESHKIAIKALEEIQQYRAIGTVKGYERAIESSIENYNLYKEYKAKVQDFEAIGSVEEFKALKEAHDLYEHNNNLAYVQGRTDAIDGFVDRLSKYLNAESATKYGNKNAEQQRNSYDTLMKYEIADAIDDVAEQLKAGGTDD